MLTIRTTTYTHDGHEYVDTLLTTDNTPGEMLVVRSMRTAGMDDRHVVVEQLRALAKHIQSRGLTTDPT